MNNLTAPHTLYATSVLQALPIGVAVIDAGQRVVVFNPAYCDSLDLPQNSVTPGMRLADVVRPAAYRGVFGPGDPEEQLAAILAPDGVRAGRLRRRTFNGRSFDIHSAPLPDGGYVLCAIETTALIHDRAEAEATLARHNTALATLRNGLAAFGPDAGLLFANPRFAELLGLPLDRLRAVMNFAGVLDLMARRDEFSGADGKSFIAGQRALDRSRPSAIQWSGSNVRTIDISSDPLPDGGWTMTVSDVSALARAEDESRRRVTILNSILDAIPHGVCVYSADHYVTMFNRAYTDVMAGAPLNVGDHLGDVIRRRAAAGEYGPGDVDQIFAQQMSFDISRPQARKRQRPNGMTVDVRTSPLPDGGYISVVTDITPLTAAEAVVSRHAEEMAVMLSSIRHGVVLWGADRRLVASNAVAAELLDLPPGMLTPGRTRDELVEGMLRRGHFGAGEQAAQRVRALREIDRSGTVIRQSITGTGRMLDFRSDPTPGGGWVSTFTDVTEARTAEIELRRAKEAAEAANQAKSRFLATMSHELRTPLNAVIGFSDQLLRDAANPSPERVAEFAGQINEAGRHLLGLINSILDVSRIEAGRFDLASDKVDVARLVRNCIRQMDASAQAAEIALIAELPDNLPLLQADERRLQQVLNNLLSNAVKFTHAGGTVTASALHAPGGELVVTVSDTGIGIPDDDIERVFEPFTQLDSSLARRFQGAGLGLYVARALVAGHGGRLLLRSAVDRGTEAEIRLPSERVILGGRQAPALHRHTREQPVHRHPNLRR